MKIICVGYNYLKHIKELKGIEQEEPVLFMKPDSALIPKKHPFVLPHFSKNVHYEIEVVVRINKLGKHIEEHLANEYYKEVALGIDFTARDKQIDLKKYGLPWEKAKAFDFSAYVSPFISCETLDLNDLNFRLEKNGIIVQQSNTKNMIYNFNTLISYISKYFTLKIGDIIFTGTPEGVGVVEEGDILKGYLNDNQMFSLPVV